MDQISWAEIVAVTVAIIASIPAILHFLRTRFKDKAEGVAIVKEGEKADAEATGVIVTAATALLEPYIRRVEQLEARDVARESELGFIKIRLDRVERNNYLLCDGVRRLIHQIRSLGAEPVFDISEELCEEIANGGEEE